jgi:hypothetical protein
MAKKNRTNTTTNSTQAAKLSESRIEAIRDVLTEISSASSSINDEDADYTTVERFSCKATRINADLAQAAYLEAEGDNTVDTIGSGFFEMGWSTEYQTLRERFIEEATNDAHEYAFQTAIWRAYSAGRVSALRLLPHSEEDRLERKEQEYAHRQLMNKAKQGA